MNARIEVSSLAIAMLIATAGLVSAQGKEIPLSPDCWTATDTIKFESHLGRPSLYINRGSALAKGVGLTDGTFEFDFASAPKSDMLGVGFHAAGLRQLEVIYFRAGANHDDIQYAPAFNGIAAAWQIYHYASGSADAVIPRETWVHAKVDLRGSTATLYLNSDTTPALVVPRLAGTGGDGLGVWATNFGKGAWYSNIRYSPRRAMATAEAAPSLPPRTITDWRLSPAIEAPMVIPDLLPDLREFSWERVRVQPEGFVLVDRYRAGPGIIPPSDPETGQPLRDSIMGGAVKGSMIVYGRTTIHSYATRVARLQFVFSDAVTIFLNGKPLYSETNPAGFRGDGNGVMDRIGKVVYLPLQKGDNELVFAVTEFFGGWAFGAQLDP